MIHDFPGSMSYVSVNWCDKCRIFCHILVDKTKSQTLLSHQRIWGVAHRHLFSYTIIDYLCIEIIIGQNIEGLSLKLNYWYFPHVHVGANFPSCGKRSHIFRESLGCSVLLIMGIEVTLQLIWSILAVIRHWQRQCNGMFFLDNTIIYAYLKYSTLVDSWVGFCAFVTHKLSFFCF